MRYKIVLYADPKTEMSLVDKCNQIISERIEMSGTKDKNWVVLHVVPPVHIVTKPGKYIADAQLVLLRKKDTAITDLYEENGIPVQIFTLANMTKAEDKIKALEPPIIDAVE